MTQPHTLLPRLVDYPQKMVKIMVREDRMGKNGLGLREYGRNQVITYQRNILNNQMSSKTCTDIHFNAAPTERNSGLQPQHRGFQLNGC